MVATPAFSAADSALRREASSLSAEASSDARAFVSERSAAVAAFCAAVFEEAAAFALLPAFVSDVFAAFWTMPLLFLISLLPLRSERRLQRCVPPLPPSFQNDTVPPDKHHLLLQRPENHSMSPA